MKGNTEHIDDPGLYSYDDIQPPVEARYNGERGVIAEKGDQLNSTSGTRHICFMYATGDRAGDEVLIHENIVNKYLKQGKKLWIDFHQ